MNNDQNITLHSQYNVLKNEVITLRNQIDNISKKDERVYNLYKGTMILFSSLILEPSFLFIGINPNQGNFEEGKDNDFFEPLEEFEYISMQDCYENDNYLSKQTRELFMKTKYSENFCNSVKINAFFQATKNVKDLNKLIDILRDDYSINLYEYSKKWIIELINIIKPKIVICEGKRVLDTIGVYYNQVYKWENGIAKSILCNNIRIVGYKRRFSQILAKEEVIFSINRLFL
jgi:hypothetical protein